MKQRTVDDLIEYLENYRGQRVYPNYETASKEIDRSKGAKYFNLSDMEAFWYEGESIEVDS